MTSKQIFKPKSKNYIKENYKKLDRKVKLIPLSFKPIMKKMIWEKDIIKKIIIKAFELNEKYEKTKFYYGKSILQSTYPVNIRKNSYIITINEDSWKNKKEKAKIRNILDTNNSFVYSFIQKDKNAEKYNNKVYRLILNMNDQDDYYIDKELLLKDKKNSKSLKGLYIKNINYYNNMYKKGKQLKDSELILAALASKSFKELYEILNQLYEEKDVKRIMSFAKRASENIEVRLKWKEYKNS